MYINLTHERGVEEIREYKYPSVMFPFGVQHVCHIPPKKKKQLAQVR
jgi:hypothetical protein